MTTNEVVESTIRICKRLCERRNNNDISDKMFTQELDAYLKSLYKDGFESGRKEGYKRGVNDGYSDARYIFLAKIEKLITED